jgi:predicted transglutaminase-like cysteine proteinase
MQNALPPMAWTEFTLAPKPARLEILAIVNRLVNNGIDPQQDTSDVTDPWTIAPKVGWCHDYAVSKQWLLTAFGIPSQLCECSAPDGEHHVVVLVDGAALDNLTGDIGPMRYPVVRMQSAQDPNLWDQP